MYDSVCVQECLITVGIGNVSSDMRAAQSN
jgi:hypothetical protein